MTMDTKGNELTPKHNESAQAATIGGVVGGVLSAALIAKWPDYSGLWVAVGAAITAAIGIGLKWSSVKK